VAIQFGGNPHQIERAIEEALLSDMGSSFDTENADSLARLDCKAYARALSYVYSMNQRLANNLLAALMLDMLPRWETILRLVPSETDSLIRRRARVAAKLLSLGSAPTNQAVRDLMAALLGECFVDLRHVPIASANATNPGGGSVPSGVTFTDAPIASSGVGFVGVQTAQPADMTDAEYYQTISQAKAFLDDFLPAHVGFAVYRRPGFFLDTPNKLDNCWLTS
jgi:hypothetical protein